MFQNVFTDAELPLVQQLIERLPLTVTTQVGDCKAETNPICKVDIITTIPMLDVEKKLMHASTFPIAKEGYLKELTWRQIQLTPQLFVPITDKKKILEVDNLFFSRCESAAPLRDCHVCNEPSVFHLNTFPCLQNLYFENFADNCTWKFETPANSLQEISNHKFVYVDTTPGELMESCNNKHSLHELRHSSLLKFKPECSYQLIDIAADLIKPLVPLRNLVIKGREVAKQKNLLDDANVVKRHFLEYGYMYVLSLCILAWIFGVILCFVCCRKFMKYRARRALRARNERTVRYVRIREEDIQSAGAPAVVASRPQQIPSRLAIRGPTIKEIPSGIQISRT